MKKGDTIFYFCDYSELEIVQTTIKNFDDKYVNYCECNRCKKKIGTHKENHKYDTAIRLDNVYYSLIEINKALRIKLEKIYHTEHRVEK